MFGGCGVRQAGSIVDELGIVDELDIVFIFESH